MGSSDITSTPAWQALSRHHEQIGGTDLRQLFADDPARGTELTLTVGDLYIDYSKHRVTGETLSLLLDLAREAGLPERRDAMFSGSTSTPRRTGRFCTPRCGCPATPR